MNSTPVIWSPSKKVNRETIERLITEQVIGNAYSAGNFGGAPTPQAIERMRRSIVLDVLVQIGS